MLYNVGYPVQYDENEEFAADYTAMLLSGYGYSEKVNWICRMIRSTVSGTHPADEPDQILCGADISHIGSDQFYTLRGNFRDELRLVKGYKWIRNGWDCIFGRIMNSCPPDQRTAAEWIKRKI